MGVAFAPHEADALLVVDANTVLPFAIAVQRFQPVPGRCGQVSQFTGSVELPQFPQRNPLHRTKAFHSPPVIKPLRIAAAKGSDHAYRI
jgi:hypothetical protein